MPRVEDIAVDTAAPEVVRRAIGRSLIEAELASTGFAQVIAVLAPPQMAAAAAVPPVRAARVAAPTPAPSVEEAAVLASAADLEQFFSVPETSQDAALAFMRVSSAARRVKRALATTAAAATRELLEPVARAAETTVPKTRIYQHLGVMLGNIDRSGLEALEKDGRVRDVQPAPPFSLIRPTRAAASGRSSGTSWGVERLGAPRLWAAGLTGKGVLVGHLDTGVDAAHPALAGAVAHFAEFDFLGKLVPNARPHDTDNHGTHTAGTIAGRRVGTARFGVAPEAHLASAIVIEGGNVIARILGGMDWAVGQGVRILSMSLGLRGYTPAFLTLTQVLRARGVLPVFAVGNEYAGTSRSPGNYAEALSVGASDDRDGVADFSGSQRFSRPNDPLVPDLVAPGVDVLSCVPRGKYASMSGTSMATPHVAGLAALLLQAAPTARVDDLEQAIFGSCTLPPGMQLERGNRGIPDGVRAYELLTGSPLPAKGTTIEKGRKQARKRPAARKSLRRKKKSVRPARPARVRQAKKRGRAARRSGGR